MYCRLPLYQVQEQPLLLDVRIADTLGEVSLSEGAQGVSWVPVMFCSCSGWWLPVRIPFLKTPKSLIYDLYTFLCVHFNNNK